MREGGKEEGRERKRERKKWIVMQEAGSSKGRKK
jgi:hypothetical protein